MKPNKFHIYQHIGGGINVFEILDETPHQTYYNEATYKCKIYVWNNVFNNHEEFLRLSHRNKGFSKFPKLLMRFLDLNL